MEFDFLKRVNTNKNDIDIEGLIEKFVIHKNLIVDLMRKEIA
jgi:hypothetical protein